MQLRCIKNRFYVYKSVTVERRQKDMYVSRYEDYRVKHPLGTFNDLLREMTVVNWICRYPKRINTLTLLDIMIMNSYYNDEVDAFIDRTEHYPEEGDN